METDASSLYRNPRTDLEIKIAQIWKKYLGITTIGIDANFFEMGGDSLVTQQVCDALKKEFDITVTATQVFQYPTIALLSEHIAPTKNSAPLYEAPTARKTQNTSKAIAIIGMAGRFPGANSVDALWEVLKEGKETITFFKPEELDPSIPDSLKNDPQYVKARGILPDAKTFDASFFKINQKLAEIMDPQIRLFLEIAWEVLEDTGYLPEHYKGNIGVYAGNGPNSYYKDNVLPNKQVMKQVGSIQARSANEDFLATRTAYHLNLTGPAVTVLSGCSTSLLAVSQAVEALRNGHCDVALAGGSSVTAPIHSGHLYQEGAILSADGHCRSFDAEAKGTVFSDGAGIVLLKPLELAEQDGDTIHGIIKGIGMNNDGGNKGSFSAPSSQGQAGAIYKALADANVNPSQISYVEAHGTATPLGDPIEVEGLKLAFGNQNKQGYCALGSLKSNIGHLLAASGVAGLIKTVLALKHQQIPPSIGFDTPNPAIDFENSPFFVNQTLSPWTAEGSRLAGVSSFGVGGTNVHVIVEEYDSKAKPSEAGRPLQLITWSAKTETSRSAYALALKDFLKSSPKVNLADVAYSLQTSRATFNHRSFILAKTNENAIDSLSSKDAIKSAHLNIAPSHVGFLFPGQGSQFLDMGKSLYESEAVYRDAVDTCSELLKNDLKLDIRDIIFPKKKSQETEDRLKDTQFTQPALFVTEYALSQLWMHWGLKPNVLCGHSIGEFVAAHLAGVLTLKDALHLIAVRGRLVANLPSGGMLSVRLSEARLKELLPKSLSIAAINSKHLCVVAGEHKAIEDFANILESQDIPNRLLITSHAFHSAMMEPILETFALALNTIQFKKPNIPIVSTVTGTWMTDEAITSPSYWVNHLRQTVRFADAIDTVLALDNPILLEVGPGKALATLARQQGQGKPVSVCSSLLVINDQDTTYNTLLESLGDLWLRGISVDWNAFYKAEERQKISLPSYVFDRKPCWIDPVSDTNPTVAHKVQEQAALAPSPIQVAPVDTGVHTVLSKVSEIIYNISGIQFEPETHTTHFLELGLDSLALTQVSLRLKEAFNLPISFRQLNEDLVSLELLTKYLVKQLPKEAKQEPIGLQQNEKRLPTVSYNEAHLNNASSKEAQITLVYLAEKIELLSQQIAAMQHAYPNTTYKHAHNDTINAMAFDFEPHPDNNAETEQTHKTNADAIYTILAENPPVPGAELGRDERGNPAWYVADKNDAGRYIKINL